MKIGYVPPRGAFQSIEYERHLTGAAMKARHVLQTYPEEYSFSPPARRHELLKEWVSSCDAFLGTLDTDILAARRDVGRCIPWAIFMMGRMPRGAVTMLDKHKYLHTHDIFVCNSTPDIVLGRKFFPNGLFRLVPFPCDETKFYPAGETERTQARAALGIGPDEKVLLYAGRITLEKNVHSILRTFRVVLAAVPNARLVLAGPEMNSPFVEMGAHPLEIKRTLTRLIEHLGLAHDRVLFIGPRKADDLRGLYSTADVLVNMTLHHDENFGFAQVEAMACGLPSVGTTWGGLKDSITDGLTGRQVPAIVTPAGVKVDWWSAANSIVQLLTDGESTVAMRQRCCERARSHYSVARYGERLDDVLRECVAETARGCEPLTVSAFAEEYWATCGSRIHAMPAYRRGPEAGRLYRELITHYATAPSNGHANGNGNGNGHTWCLAVPLSIQQDGRISVNDPIVPQEIPVPAHLVGSVRTLANLFAERPVLRAETVDASGAEARDALAWMHEAGLVLPSSPGILDPEAVPAALGQPAFVLREVDHRTDVVWYS